MTREIIQACDLPPTLYNLYFMTLLERYNWIFGECIWPKTG